VTAFSKETLSLAGRAALTFWLASFIIAAAATFVSTVVLGDATKNTFARGRHMKRIRLVEVCALLLGAATAAAQGVRYGVGAGLLLPVGDYHSLDKAGWIAGADVTYWLPSGSIAIRAEGSYSRTGQKQGACCLSDHTIAMAGGLVDVVYAFGNTADQIRSYLIAGVGFYNWRLSAPGFTPSSETKLGVGGGAGVAYKVGRGSTRLFLEGKVTSITVNGVSYVSIPIRVGLRFGKK